jgi:recA bacterial DNA recombination protein
VTARQRVAMNRGPMNAVTVSGVDVGGRESLDVAIARLRRRYGAAALRRGGDPLPATAWSTGIPALDDLCAGGLPRGRITLLAAGERGVTGRLTILQALAAAASAEMQVAYVDLAGSLDPGFLADLGADLDSCLVVRPPSEGAGARSPVAVGLAMARSLVAAGVPWLAVALGRQAPAGRDLAVDHAVAALAAAVEGSGAVACVATGAPPAAPLAYASSLTLACAPLGWQEAHGDVAGLRVAVRVEKSKVGPAVRPGGVSPPSTTALLVRYPRPQAAAEVVGLPAVVTGGVGAVPAWVDSPAARLTAAR